MNNIFQGREPIRRCIADSLGYAFDEANDDFRFNWFTKDIYFPAFFYLYNRFGAPTKNDNYKEAGVWSFSIKDFIVQITFLSTDLEIVIFGEKWHGHGGLTVGEVKRQREQIKHLDELLPYFLQGDPDPNKEIFEKGLSTFLEQKGVNKEMEELDSGDLDGWIDYVSEYNYKIIGVDVSEYNEKYGQNYSNAYTKRSLKTLSQFLHNMLTPIWVRDCGYNIKGRSEREFERYDNNIKIQQLP